jgi:hypothetical protein
MAELITISILTGPFDWRSLLRQFLSIIDMLTIRGAIAACDTGGCIFGEFVCSGKEPEPDVAIEDMGAGEAMAGVGVAAGVVAGVAIGAAIV